MNQSQLVRHYLKSNPNANANEIRGACMSMAGFIPSDSVISKARKQMEYTTAQRSKDELEIAWNISHAGTKSVREMMVEQQLKEYRDKMKEDNVPEAASTKILQMLDVELRHVRTKRLKEAKARLDENRNTSL